MKASNKKYKYIKLFLALFIIGCIVGIIYFNNLSNKNVDELVNAIKNENIIFKPINNITNHLKILSVISLFSLIYIGLPLSLGLIISEGFIFFIRINILYQAYKISGIFYGLIYYIVCNLLYIYFLYIIFKRVVIICKKIYKLKLKNESFNFNEILQLLNRNIYIIIIIFISDILIYLYADNILKTFAFLLK